MSEFPEWFEERLGFSHITGKDTQKWHRKLRVVYELIPDIDNHMTMQHDTDKTWLIVPIAGWITILILALWGWMVS